MHLHVMFNGIEVDWENFTCHRLSHCRGSSTTNTTMKSKGTSHIEIPTSTPMSNEQIAKLRATPTKKNEELLLSSIIAMKARMQALLADLEAIVVENQIVIP